MSGFTVTTTDKSCNNKYNLGAYNIFQDSIVLCEDNIKESSYTVNQIMRHEMIHAIQENFGYEDEAIIPDPLLTHMAREVVPPGEAMYIILNYPENQVDLEFEARILQNLPNWIVGPLLFVSEMYENIFLKR